MALFKFAKFISGKLNLLRNSSINTKMHSNKLIQNVTSYSCLNQERYYRASFSKTMKIRRKIAGPERIRRRNEWHNWNYNAELFAFNARLQENISENTLRCAFIHDSYLKSEEEKRKKLDIPSQDIQLDLQSNASLVNQGHNIASNYIKRYLTHSFQKLPELGIMVVHDYLMSDEVLSHVSFNLGTSDLIFCTEYPPEKSTLASTLKAIIGSIAKDANDVTKAEHFVLDFICPQLIGKDILELWDIENPLDILNAILEKRSMQPVEPRLIFESGRNTIEAIYHVGVYSNREFLGSGPGETLPIAVEMAAYDALRRILNLKENEHPLCFGQKARTVDLNSENITEQYPKMFNIYDNQRQ